MDKTLGINKFLTQIPTEHQANKNTAKSLKQLIATGQFEDLIDNKEIARTNRVFTDIKDSSKTTEQSLDKRIKFNNYLTKRTIEHEQNLSKLENSIYFSSKNDRQTSIGNLNDRIANIDDVINMNNEDLATKNDKLDELMGQIKKLYGYIDPLKNLSNDPLQENILLGLLKNDPKNVVQLSPEDNLAIISLTIEYHQTSIDINKIKSTLTCLGDIKKKLTTILKNMQQANYHENNNFYGILNQRIDDIFSSYNQTLQNIKNTHSKHQMQISNFTKTDNAILTINYKFASLEQKALNSLFFHQNDKVKFEKTQQRHIDNIVKNLSAEIEIIKTDIPNNINKEDAKKDEQVLTCYHHLINDIRSIRSNINSYLNNNKADADKDNDKVDCRNNMSLKLTKLKVLELFIENELQSIIDAKLEKNNFIAGTNETFNDLNTYLLKYINRSREKFYARGKKINEEFLINSQNLTKQFMIDNFINKSKLELYWCLPSSFDKVKAKIITEIDKIINDKNNTQINIEELNKFLQELNSDNAKDKYNYYSSFSNSLDKIENGYKKLGKSIINDFKKTRNDINITRKNHIKFNKLKIEAEDCIRKGERKLVFCNAKDIQKNKQQFINALDKKIKKIDEEIKKIKEAEDTLNAKINEDNKADQNNKKELVNNLKTNPLILKYESLKGKLGARFKKLGAKEDDTYKGKNFHQRVTKRFNSLNKHSVKFIKSAFNDAKNNIGDIYHTAKNNQELYQIQLETDDVIRSVGNKLFYILSEEQYKKYEQTLLGEDSVIKTKMNDYKSRIIKLNNSDPLKTALDTYLNEQKKDAGALKSTVASICKDMDKHTKESIETLVDSIIKLQDCMDSINKNKAWGVSSKLWFDSIINETSSRMQSSFKHFQLKYKKINDDRQKIIRNSELKHEIDDLIRYATNDIKLANANEFESIKSSIQKQINSKFSLLNTSFDLEDEKQLREKLDAFNAFIDKATYEITNESKLFDKNSELENAYKNKIQIRNNNYKDESKSIIADKTKYPRSLAAKVSGFKIGGKIIWKGVRKFFSYLTLGISKIYNYVSYGIVYAARVIYYKMLSPVVRAISRGAIWCARDVLWLAIKHIYNTGECLIKEVVISAFGAFALIGSVVYHPIELAVKSIYKLLDKIIRPIMRSLIWVSKNIVFAGIKQVANIVWATLKISVLVPLAVIAYPLNAVGYTIMYTASMGLKYILAPAIKNISRVISWITKDIIWFAVSHTVNFFASVIHGIGLHLSVFIGTTCYVVYKAARGLFDVIRRTIIEPAMTSISKLFVWLVRDIILSVMGHLGNMSWTAIKMMVLCIAEITGNTLAASYRAIILLLHTLDVIIKPLKWLFYNSKKMFNWAIYTALHLGNIIISGLKILIQSLPLLFTPLVYLGYAIKWASIKGYHLIKRSAHYFNHYIIFGVRWSYFYVKKLYNIVKQEATLKLHRINDCSRRREHYLELLPEAAHLNNNI